MMAEEMPRKVMGWGEWCSLPSLTIPAIKAKIDTGAKSTALHAIDIQQVENKVLFKVNPLIHRKDLFISCQAKLHDIRSIKNSGGIIENRYVIRTPLMIDQEQWEIDITLTNRHQMSFRLLIGRDAIKGKFVVDPGLFLVLFKPKKKDVMRLYENCGSL